MVVNHFHGCFQPGLLFIDRMPVAYCVIVFYLAKIIIFTDFSSFYVHRLFTERQLKNCFAVIESYAGAGPQFPYAIFPVEWGPCRGV